MSKKKTTARKSSNRRRRTIYRLACAGCDREDFDGIPKLPTDWGEITEYQTRDESLREVALGDSDRSALDWFTHLGVCPDCQREEG